METKTIRTLGKEDSRACARTKGRNDPGEEREEGAGVIS